jgi:uncharacterized protein YcbK (DUF882 family)
LRTAQCCGLAAILLLSGSNGLQNAAANGETRTLSFHHTHRDDDITVTFKRNGRYDQDALKKLNRFLRDWRNDEETRMDPRLFDILWEVHRTVNAKEPINVVSSYRSPKTNSMLRRRSRGVARFSQHMLGKAIDFRIPNVAAEELRIAGLKLQHGGVGFYPGSGFVHLDVGNVRHWPRMSREQLARVFPDGRTVHVPADGQPLPGYALALADIEKRGGSPSQPSLDAARNAGISTASVEQSPDKSKRSLLATLFSGGKDEDEDNDTTGSTERNQAPAATSKPAVMAAAVVAAAVATNIPMPIARPMIVAMAASAEPAAAKTPRTTQQKQPAGIADTKRLASLTPNEIISARGMWPEASSAPTEAPQAQDDLITTASLSQKLAAAASHHAGASGEIALAYAAHSGFEPASHTVSLGSSLVRTATTASLAPAGLTTVIKKTLAPLHAAKSAARTTNVKTAAAPGDRFSDPWMRAMALTPSVQHFMTAMPFGIPDYRTLRPLLHKPSSAVMMVFSDDPHLGMTTGQFSGSVTVFQPTVTFSNRTAALQ